MSAAKSKKKQCKSTEKANWQTRQVAIGKKKFKKEVEAYSLETIFLDHKEIRHPIRSFPHKTMRKVIKYIGFKIFGAMTGKL